MTLQVPVKTIVASGDAHPSRLIPTLPARSRRPRGPLRTEAVRPEVAERLPSGRVRPRAPVGRGLKTYRKFSPPANRTRPTRPNPAPRSCAESQLMLDTDPVRDRFNR